VFLTGWESEAYLELPGAVAPVFALAGWAAEDAGPQLAARRSEVGGSARLCGSPRSSESEPDLLACRLEGLGAQQAETLGGSVHESAVPPGERGWR
jgi:hypothetical protein